MTVRELKLMLQDVDDTCKVNVIMDGVIDENPDLNCDGDVLYIESVSPSKQ